MTNEPRKATEILLELEAKVEYLISLFKKESFSNQILSNQISDLIQNLKQTSGPKITAETVNTIPQVNVSPIQNFRPIDPERQVAIIAEDRLPQTDSPEGFRRTSRPETFQENTSYANPLLHANEKAKPPPGRGSDIVEVVIPTQPISQKTVNIKAQEQLINQKQDFVQNAILVTQRIVNKDGKSIFLADVEVTDLNTSQLVFKTRTNGSGNWQASLATGNYKVVIRKKESAQQAKMESSQSVVIKGDENPLNMPVLILK